MRLDRFLATSPLVTPWQENVERKFRVKRGASPTLSSTAISYFRGKDPVSQDNYRIRASFDAHLCSASNCAYSKRILDHPTRFASTCSLPPFLILQIDEFEETD